MNLYIRLILALIKGAFLSRIHPLTNGVEQRRVMPWDIDLFGHMNNGRYLQISDVSRLAWMQRAGILRVIVKNRWSAVLGGSMVRYCKALKPGQRYQVETKLVCWDERWFYMEHRFTNLKGQTAAICITRAALRSKNAWVSTQNVVDQVAPNLVSPEPSVLVQQWMQNDKLFLLKQATCSPSTHQKSSIPHSHDVMRKSA